MTLKTIKKINQKLKFLYRKNQFLTPELRQLLCNAIIQPHFDYTCSAWYPNLTQKLKKKLQVMQNKCVCFCLQLDKMSKISHKEFKDLNWLPVFNRFEQCVVSIVLKKNLNNFFEIQTPVKKPYLSLVLHFGIKSQRN